MRLEPSFAVVLADSGAGVLTAAMAGRWRMEHGNTFVVPWGAGTVNVEGQVELLRCLPPLPEDAAKDDPGAAKTTANNG